MALLIGWLVFRQVRDMELWSTGLLAALMVLGPMLFVGLTEYATLFSRTFRVSQVAQSRQR